MSNLMDILFELCGKFSNLPFPKFSNLTLPKFNVKIFSPKYFGNINFTAFQKIGSNILEVFSSMIPYLKAPLKLITQNAKIPLKLKGITPEFVNGALVCIGLGIIGLLISGLKGLIIGVVLGGLILYGISLFPRGYFSTFYEMIFQFFI